MEVPKNCSACEWAKLCRSWYGGTGCKHKTEIAKKVTEV